MKRGTKPSRYALYNRYDLLATGTVKEIANELSLSEQYIRKIGSKPYVGPYRLDKLNARSKPRKKFDYALYNGDDFIVLGTIQQIADYLERTVNYVWKIRTEKYQGHYTLIKLEE